MGTPGFDFRRGNHYTGDMKTPEQIVQENQGLAHWGARRFLWTGIPMDDLIQCALLGVYNAALKYDPNRGAQFATVAHWYMLQQLTSEAAKMRSIISVPILESKLGVTEHVASLNSNGRDGTYSEMAGGVIDTDASSKIERDGVSRDVETSLDVLSERERFVVAHLHGLDDAERAHSEKSIGKIMGVSRQRVAQIKQKAHDKLRHELHDYAEG